jgi:hypothetical protein
MYDKVSYIFIKYEFIVGAQFHLRVLPPILTKRAFVYSLCFGVGITRLTKSKKFDKL